eukprot:gene7534-biopygen15094
MRGIQGRTIFLLEGGGSGRREGGAYTGHCNRPPVHACTGHGSRNDPGHGPTPLWKDWYPIFPKGRWTAAPGPPYEHRQASAGETTQVLVVLIADAALVAALSPLPLRAAAPARRCRCAAAPLLRAVRRRPGPKGLWAVRLLLVRGGCGVTSAAGGGGWLADAAPTRPPPPPPVPSPPRAREVAAPAPAPEKRPPEAGRGGGGGAIGLPHPWSNRSSPPAPRMQYKTKCAPSHTFHANAKKNTPPHPRTQTLRRQLQSRPAKKKLARGRPPPWTSKTAVWTPENAVCRPFGPSGSDMYPGGTPGNEHYEILTDLGIGNANSAPVRVSCSNGGNMGWGNPPSPPLRCGRRPLGQSLFATPNPNAADSPPPAKQKHLAPHRLRFWADRASGGGCHGCGGCEASVAAARGSAPAPVARLDGRGNARRAGRGAVLCGKGRGGGEGTTPPPPLLAELTMSNRGLGNREVNYVNPQNLGNYRKCWDFRVLAYSEGQSGSIVHGGGYKGLYPLPEWRAGIAKARLYGVKNYLNAIPRHSLKGWALRIHPYHSCARSAHQLQEIRGVAVRSIIIFWFEGAERFWRKTMTPPPPRGLRTDTPPPTPRIAAPHGPAAVPPPGVQPDFSVPWSAAKIWDFGKNVFVGSQ